MLLGILFIGIIVFLNWFRPTVIKKLKNTLGAVFLIIMYYGFSQKYSKDFKIFIPVIVFIIGICVDYFHARKANTLDKS